MFLFKMPVCKRMTIPAAILCLLSAAVAVKAGPGAPQAPLQIAKQGFFYAGGRTVTRQDSLFWWMQCLCNTKFPQRLLLPIPSVLIHGNYQNGSNFLGTPDDREGWAEYFLRRGFSVYVIDQPARGRSLYDAMSDGPAAMIHAETIQRQFTAVERYNLWPQAHLHTQWPGTGVAGDPVYEQFRASQNPSITDNVIMDAANRAALGALLHRIGPAILLTHSRSGPFGWETADDVPELVKAIIAVEPSGPPFYNVIPLAAGSDPVLGRAWGLTSDRMTYDPPVSDPAQLGAKREDQPRGADLQRCLVPAGAQKLPHLAGIPVMIVTAEASYHAGYDHCTSEYLSRAGVMNDFVRLSEHGIHGNGHMVMIEKNNLEIAGLIADGSADT